MKRKLCSLALAALLLLSLLTACGAGSSDTASSATAGDTGGSGADYVENGWAADAESPTAAPQEDSGSTGEVQTQKKIYTAMLEAETTAFDDASQALRQLVESYGGYFQNQSVSNRNAYRYGTYTIRIPAEHFADFLLQVGDSCHVLYQTSAEEDVTDAYYDVESRLTTQRTKLERLQNLLSRAETMEDIITIESAISDTELEIEQLTGSLRTYDNRINYATVDMTLSEVYKLSTEEEAPTTFGGRLGAAFLGGLRSAGNFLENLTVSLAYNWVLLLVVLAVVLVVVRVVLRRKKKLTSPPPDQQDLPK